MTNRVHGLHSTNLAVPSKVNFPQDICFEI